MKFAIYVDQCGGTHKLLTFFLIPNKSSSYQLLQVFLLELFQLLRLVVIYFQTFRYNMHSMELVNGAGGGAAEESLRRPSASPRLLSTQLSPIINLNTSTSIMLHAVCCNLFILVVVLKSIEIIVRKC